MTIYQKNAHLNYQPRTPTPLRSKHPSVFEPGVDGRTFFFGGGVLMFLSFEGGNAFTPVSHRNASLHTSHSFTSSKFPLIDAICIAGTGLLHHIHGGRSRRRPDGQQSRHPDGRPGFDGCRLPLMANALWTNKCYPTSYPPPPLSKTPTPSSNHTFHRPPLCPYLSEGGGSWTKLHPLLTSHQCLRTPPTCAATS
jgi:hypothetical protein